MPAWIDFKELRAQLDARAVLRLYNIQVHTKGDQATGLCPLPTHPTRTDGSKRTPSFSINLTRGVWRCFGCKQSGNLIDLACCCDGLDPTNGTDVRKTALKLREAFNLKQPMGDAPPQQKQQVRDAPAAGAIAPGDGARKGSTEYTTSGTIVVNPVLDFDLKNLDPEHPYLRERGLSQGTVKQFGLGYASRGMLRGRIAIPLHNERGELVGYAGRLTKDRDISQENPKYRFPSDRERGGQILAFRKSHLLYNLHRVGRPASVLTIVEGFFSVFWLTQADHPNVVALMGSDCSSEQGEQIVAATTPDAIIYILTDGDDAGDACAYSIFREVAPQRACRWLKLPKGLQPTDFNALQLSFLWE